MQTRIFSIVLLGVFLAWPSKTASQNRESKIGPSITNILDSMRAEYDKRVRPNYGGAPVVVGISMYILSVTSLSEVDMDFTLNLYFRQMWNDPRLKFKGPNGIKTITVGASFLQTIWTPDTFMVNEKKSEYHLIPTPNEFIRISENGDVMRSTRLTLTASCPMNLKYFPMDTQLCSLDIESYGYTMTDIRYNWAKGLESVGIATDVPLPEFKVLGHRQQTRQISLETGNYSRLGFEIQFVRSVGYFIIQTYFPAGCVVIVSWIALCLDRSPNAILMRVALGVVTVLIVTISWTTTYAALPKISYLKAIDIYLAACFYMVMAALLESVIVGCLSRRVSIRLRDLQKTSETTGSDVITSRSKTTEHQKIKVFGVTPSGLDIFSRITFPIVFIIFNVLYWMTYMNITGVVPEDLVLLKA